MEFSTVNVVIEGGMEYPFPPLIPIDQSFSRNRIDEISNTIASEMKKIPMDSINGKSIAITVGSRGITGIVNIISKNNNAKNELLKKENVLHAVKLLIEER